MLESIYRAAGLRVGLFTSPHLIAFGERIQVNRSNIPEHYITRLVTEMRALLEHGWGSGSRITHLSSVASAKEDDAPLCQPTNPSFHQSNSSPLSAHSTTPPLHHATSSLPTFFEVVTVMALRYFAEQQCDLVIWETGLGGRLDATNIVRPVASVITNIQYDHQQWLGESLQSIATEKAGIIKPAIPIITATDEPEALKVIQETARRQAALLTKVAPSEIHRPPLNALELPLIGNHQRLNAALALATVRVLAPTIAISDDAIRAGLSRVRWLGRLQLLNRPCGQKVLLDGAHNVAGAEALGAALKQYFPSASPALILGILRDKNFVAICDVLAPLARRIFLVPVSSERAAPPEELLQACLKANPLAESRACNSLAEALSETQHEPFLLVTGSLYLVGEALEALQSASQPGLDERALNEWALNV
jgi:dihydrofolate synthase/folylpolyglutamate synthase